MNGWHYVTTPRAERDLRQLSGTDRTRVFEALDRFVAAPDHGDVRKLQGQSAEWRLRIGGIRVRFRRDDSVRAIVVLRVLPRARAYRN